MGSETGNASQDDRDSDDEEEYEEGGGNRLLGFMFGNVDNSGELDVDYLDEDAKEHLDALATELESALTAINMPGKSSKSPSTAEEGYNEKAIDAVDYEDIEEQYEGPEVEAATEEDHLLPKSEYVSADVLGTALEHKSSVYDDENYDEDEDYEKDIEVAANDTEIHPTHSAGLGVLPEHNQESAAVGKNSESAAMNSPAGQGSETVLSEDIAPDDSQLLDPVETQDNTADMLYDEEADITEGVPDAGRMTPLPILCFENGTAILRFSEIFGVHLPSRKAERRERAPLIRADKYISTGVSHAIEEDEEDFLKDPFQGNYTMSAVVADDDSSISDDNTEISDSGFRQASLTQPSDRKRDSCSSAEPLSQECPLDPLLDCKSERSHEFYLLDQLDWEDKIVWGNSPTRSNDSVESCDLSGPDSGTAVSRGNGNEVGLQYTKSDSKVAPENDSQSQGIGNSLGPTEQFSRIQSAGLGHFSCMNGTHHEEHLSLEPQVEKHGDAAKENVPEGHQHIGFLGRFNELSTRNDDLEEGSWLENIIWESGRPIPRPKLIFDLQDEFMLFEVSDDIAHKHLQLHARAMIVAKSAESANGDSMQPDRGGLAEGRFNIGNDKFYSNRKASPQLKSILKKRTAHGVKILHSIPALKLQTMRPKLSNKDIANFHRPKAVWYPHGNEVAVKEQEKLPTQGSMKIILKSLGGKGSKMHVDAEETISSVKIKAAKKLDLRPTEAVKILCSGRELEDHKTLADQDVRPNSLLHLVRTRIYPLATTPRHPGENKSLRPPGAFKKKSDLSSKDGHVYLMEYFEERPLLLGNVGMGARLCTYYQKLSSDDQMGDALRNSSSGLGTVLSLDPADKSPFLGDVKPGSRQSSLETNMYRAPVFPHKVASTDFLLVRSAKGKLSIRRIDNIHVVGQEEPHMEVMSPVAKGLQMYMMNRLLVYMYREFRAAEKRGVTPYIPAEELSAQFPNISETFLRKRLKHCADLLRRSNGQQRWVMRRNFHIPSEEELRRMVTPENVCAYESMLAGLHRLKRLGITRLTHLTGPTQLAALSSAMNQLPYEAIALFAASHIERELQITPWNLSSNFVACTSQDKENIERLEITGVGDPSGRGLGFSYVRLPPKAPISNTMVKKKPTVVKGSTVTGTDADLRRLSMEAAREVLLKFNVPDEQITKLTRWHRIALIRKLSSERAASGIEVDSMAISKFARGQRMSFLQLQQQTRDKCQEIWDRQVMSLSAVDGDENESDSEAYSDLDSFAGDLENLLDAEEGEESEEDNLDYKHEKSDAVRGLKMRRNSTQPLLDEEIEDEAAEAAELRRLLMDDDEIERKRKKKARPAMKKLGPQGLLNAESIKKKSFQVKHKFGSVRTDDPFAARQNDARDLIEVDAYKSITVKPVKSGDAASKKVKLTADGEKKERKSARERFVCGACGQLGHMRTNKNCPRYGEDPEPQGGQETTSEKANSLDPSIQSQQKSSTKKPINKSSSKAPPVDASDGERYGTKPKSLKVKCASVDSVPNKIVSGPTTPVSEQPSTSEAEVGNKPAPKISKIKITNKMKTEDSEPQKPSIVFRPPSDASREQPRKKVVFKQPKEIITLDQDGMGGGVDTGYRKIKKMVDLTASDAYMRQDARPFGGEGIKGKQKESRRLFEEEEEEEERRRNAERLKEEKSRRIYMEEMRMIEEQDRLAELRKYEEAIRIEREEEERQKAQKKKKKKKRSEPKDEYFEDYPIRRNTRGPPERDRPPKRKTVVELGRYGAEYVPPTKRRRGGEVALANILESIVESLKASRDVSYLFLKPVSKKDAPDYLDIIERPMDLSTIRDRVRRMEYKDRGGFRKDVWQIAYNAHVYNKGRHPAIPPLAEKLLDLCDYMLEEHDASLTEAESSIADL